MVEFEFEVWVVGICATLDITVIENVGTLSFRWHIYERVTESARCRKGKKYSHRPYLI